MNNQKISLRMFVRKLNPPDTADDIKSMDYSEISNKFVEQGFVSVNSEEVYDLNPDTTKVDYINEVMINDSASFLTTDEFPFDANVLVTCHYPYSKYKAKLKVKFNSNLLFDKYDVGFTIDDKKQGTHPHGESWNDEIELKEGEHTLFFTSTEDSSI